MRDITERLRSKDLISKDACEKYAEVCRYRHSRLMDIGESTLFCALEKVCKQAALAAEVQDKLSVALSSMHDLRDARDSLTDRLAEAEALLREAHQSVEHAAYQLGYAGRNEAMRALVRIDAFLAPDSATHRENERE